MQENNFHTSAERKDNVRGRLRKIGDKFKVRQKEKLCPEG